MAPPIPTFARTKSFIGDETPNTDRDIDGGRAWLTVGAMFFPFMIVGGTLYGFGVFVSPLLVEFPDAGRMGIGFVGTLSTAIFLALGPWVGRMSDRFGPEKFIAAGGVFVGAGLVISSCATSLWQLTLSYGVVCGIGFGCVATPSIAVVGGRFVKHRGLANGLTVSGAGLGTTLLSFVNQKMIGWLGWRLALRWSALWCAVCIELASACLLIPGIGRKARMEGRRSESHVKLFDLSMFKNMNFVMLFVVNIVLSFGYLVPFMFLVRSGMDIGMSAGSAADLLIIVGACNAVARAAIGWLADALLGRLLVMWLSMLIMGSATVCWGFITLPSLLFVYAAVFGVFAGAFVAMIPPITADLFGRKDIGAFVGLLNFGASFGAIGGPTVAGWIFDTTNSFVVPAIVSGALMACTAPVLWWIGHRSPDVNFGGRCRKGDEVAPSTHVAIELV